MENKKSIKIEDIIAEYKKHFYMTDFFPIELLAALCINMKMDGEAIWVFLIGASSAGKTEVVNMAANLKNTETISNLTANTFLSSMTNKKGVENSLLHKLGTKGMIIFKDFTSIITTPKETRDQINSQLREIFDGKFTKLSGNGNSQSWAGKIVAMMACTDEIYHYDSETAGLGRRALYYEMEDPNDEVRIIMAKTSIKNRDSIIGTREKLQSMFREFIESNWKAIKPANLMPHITEKEEEELIRMIDFTTKARGGVRRNFRGELISIYSPEVPMRASNQIIKLADTLLFLYELKDLNDYIKSKLFKMSFDSIPRDRRRVIKLMCQYKDITSKGAAMLLGVPTDATKTALEELNAHRICERFHKASEGKDYWRLYPEHKELIMKYVTIDIIDETKSLESEEESDSRYFMATDNLDNYAKSISHNSNEIDDIGAAKEAAEISKRNEENFMELLHSKTAKDRIGEINVEVSKLNVELSMIKKYPVDTKAKQLEINNKIAILEAELGAIKELPSNTIIK